MAIRLGLGNAAKVLGLAFAAMAIGGGSATADIVYGIDDSANIVTVNTTTKQVLSSQATGLGTNANGLALDLANNRLLFRAPENGALRAFDLATSAISTVLSSGLTGSASNAALFGGAYWYVAQGTDDLYRVDLNTLAVTYQKSFSGAENRSFSFGDIVITNNGDLYGSTSQGFFTLNVADATGTYDLITSATPQLQLALKADGSGIIGHQHGGANAGKWYDVTFTGGYSEITGFTTAPLRDLAGAVPEPSSIAMMGLGGISLLTIAVRRRRQAS